MSGRKNHGLWRYNCLGTYINTVFIKFIAYLRKNGSGIDDMYKIVPETEN